MSEQQQQTQQQTADQQADQQAGGQEQQTQEQQTSTQEEDNVFKQEDVNNIVARESKKAQEKLLKQLGIEDFDNAKEGMKQFKEWQDQQKTDQEKQAEQLKTLETNYSKVNEENGTLKAQLSAFNAGVHSDYTGDVVTLAKSMVNDDVTIDDAIKQVVDKYPHFKGEQQTDDAAPSFSTGKHQGGSGGDSFAKALLGK